LVLGVALAVISSVDSAVQRSSDLGRSTQVFFAAEAGLESAFFHHNARGQGVHFEDASAPQKIALLASSVEVDWTLEGRIDEVEGLLKEGQKIRIPLFWDDSADPTKEPPFDEDGEFVAGHDQAGILTDDFILEFSNAGIPGDFDFGTEEPDAVLLDWAVSRQHATNGLQTFIPQRGTSNICASDTTFICREAFLITGGEIDSSSLIDGEILPGGDPDTLNHFMGDLESQQFILSFQSLLPFTDTDGDKIEGISFSLIGDDIPRPPLPKSAYTVSSEVSLGNFSKVITAEVLEKTTIGAFDYIIFD